VEDNKNNIRNENFEFSIGINDTLFTLTFNPSIYRDNVSNLISKIVVVKEFNYINLNKLSNILAAMGIKELNIFSINDGIEKMNVFRRDNGSLITYAELKREDLVTLLNNEKADFSDYNKYSLYILRDGGFLDIKNLFSLINGYEVNVGRGGGQKAHILSPLDLRLSSYLMAMFNFNYGLISNLNSFNNLDKNRYLSYMDKTLKKRSYKPYKNIDSK
jgi:hypothetical protein